MINQNTCHTKTNVHLLVQLGRSVIILEIPEIIYKSLNLGWYLRSVGLYTLLNMLCSTNLCISRTGFARGNLHGKQPWLSL